MNTAQTLRDQAATLLAEAVRLENLPQDDYPELSIIMWTQQFANEYGQLRPLGRPFPPAPKTYHYVALKVGGKWYITGRQADSSPHPWDRLVQKHLSKATHLWYVTAMQEVELG